MITINMSLHPFQHLLPSSHHASHTIFMRTVCECTYLPFAFLHGSHNNAHLAILSLLGPVRQLSPSHQHQSFILGLHGTVLSELCILSWGVNLTL